LDGTSGGDQLVGRRISRSGSGAVRERFGNRKPPSSAYATFSPVLHRDATTGRFIGGSFWDGRATGEHLGSAAADQALGPFLNPVEQNMPSASAVCEQVAASRYAGLFEDVWGDGSLDCSEDGVGETYGRIGLSIAAYEDSPEVNQFSSKFDVYWRSCLQAGNDPEECGSAEGDKVVLDPTGVLSDQEFDGLIEFGEYCSGCHVSKRSGPGGVPPLFTNFEYANIGVPKNPENPFYDMDEVFLDDGSPINPLGDEFVDLGLGDFLRTRPEWAGLARRMTESTRPRLCETSTSGSARAFPRRTCTTGCSSPWRRSCISTIPATFQRKAGHPRRWTAT
jgi:cytochrome c peroxidase